MADSKLSRPQVEHIAKLANLVLTEEEIARFQKELSEILAYVNKLQEIEVKDVEPTSQVTGLKGIMRQDKTEPERTLTQEAAVKPAKKVYNGLFVARKVL